MLLVPSVADEIVGGFEEEYSKDDAPKESTPASGDRDPQLKLTAPFVRQGASGVRATTTVRCITTKGARWRKC